MVVVSWCQVEVFGRCLTLKDHHYLWNEEHCATIVGPQYTEDYGPTLRAPRSWCSLIIALRVLVFMRW